MTHDPSPSARRTRALPERASLEHLKNEAKLRLKALHRRSPQAKLAAVQLALAREYGFASWRQLKAHVDQLDPARRERNRIFDAARAGDVATVRRAFESGFQSAMGQYSVLKRGTITLSCQISCEEVKMALLDCEPADRRMRRDARRRDFTSDRRIHDR